MRIAAVQFYINHQDKTSNWERIEAFAEKAAQQNVDLLVFPEYVIGGPGPDSVLGKQACERFCAIAKKNGLDIVAGTIIERDPDNERLYNCSYYVDKDGQVLMEYRKVHLWHPEREYLCHGRHGFQTVKNRFGIAVGMCVCWDIAFPEAFRFMALEQGAQLVIAPAYWNYEDAGEIGMKHDVLSETKFIDYICTARAFENEICMVFCNGASHREGEAAPNTSSSVTLAGRTQITVPFKGPVAHCAHDMEEMIVADVDVAGLTSDAEETYRIRRDWKEGKIFGGKKDSEVETIIFK